MHRDMLRYMCVQLGFVFFCTLRGEQLFPGSIQSVLLRKAKTDRVKFLPLTSTSKIIESLSSLFISRAFSESKSEVLKKQDNKDNLLFQGEKGGRFGSGR